MTGEPELEALTDSLYAGVPTEFVARRDELARQARASGDRDLAARIKGLRRPSVGAAYLNTASRAGLGSLAELLRLGEQLREAQSGGDFGAVRDLAGRRGRLTSEVVRELTALLAERGAAATPAGIDEVRATLAAALADPAVAAEVSGGRLDGPRTYSGFGDFGPGAPAASPRPKDAAKHAEGTSQGEDDEDATEPADARAEREAEDARRELVSAEAQWEAATTRHAEADADVREGRERVEALTAELTAARHALTVAEAELGDAARDEKHASRLVEQARRRIPASPLGAVDT